MPVGHAGRGAPQSWCLPGGFLVALCWNREACARADGGCEADKNAACQRVRTVGWGRLLPHCRGTPHAPVRLGGGRCLMGTRSPRRCGPRDDSGGCAPRDDSVGAPGDDTGAGIRRWHAASAFIRAHLRSSAFPLACCRTRNAGNDPVNREGGGPESKNRGRPHAPVRQRVRTASEPQMHAKHAMGGGAHGRGAWAMGVG